MTISATVQPIAISKHLMHRFVDGQHQCAKQRILGLVQSRVLLMKFGILISEDGWFLFGPQPWGFALTGPNTEQS